MWNKLAALRQMAMALRLPAGMSNGSEYLGHQHFARVIVVAVLLHAMALYGWHVMPRTPVVDIPVRALNIKLGDVEATPGGQDIPEPDTANSNAVENTLSRLIHDPNFKGREDVVTLDNTVDASKKALSGKAAKEKQSPDYLSKLAAATPKQFVRSTPARVPAATLGNSSASNAEIMRRYEQLISLWIQKFKLYPDEARAKGMQGETVLRIRIDRQGNIRYYILERSTGFQLLDRAAIDMIRRANPVPAVPHDYPPGDLMEFLIPVNFHLQ